MKGQKIVKRISITFLWLWLMVYLSGCDLNAETKTDLFQYKNSYVGDNSAVANIVKQLAHSEELNQISLKTEQEPYGIILEYKDINAKNVDKEMKETAIINATFLFALIQNVDWITFQFSDQELTVEKEKLIAWYQKPLDGFESERDLRTWIQEHLTSETSVNLFFN